MSVANTLTGAPAPTPLPSAPLDAGPCLQLCTAAACCSTVRRARWEDQRWTPAKDRAFPVTGTSPPGPSDLNDGQDAAQHTRDRRARRSAGRPARHCGARRRRPRSTRSAGRRRAAAMAAEQRYPRSSIEDDFNYGSNVASASVHIRMGKDSRWVKEPHGRASAPPSAGGPRCPRWRGRRERPRPALPAGASG